MSRRPAIRKAPTRQAPVVQPQAGPVPDTDAAVSGNAASASVEAMVQEGMAKLQEQFQEILQGDAGLDAKQREQMGEVFGQVLQSAASSPGPASDDAFDRNRWRETVELLRQSGGVAEDEADELIRTLNDALAPLERRESQLALEFSRRMAADGEQAAIEWLRSQTDRESADQAQEPSRIPQGDHPSLRSETVRSRSRLLRGPPR